MDIKVFIITGGVWIGASAILGVLWYWTRRKK